MNVFTFMFLVIFQSDFCHHEFTKFGLPFFQSDLIEVNKNFGRQKSSLSAPMHIKHIDYPGINYEVKIDAPALSIALGTIEKVDTSKVFGKFVIINHGNGIKVRYYHLKEIKVKIGELVKRGDKIGVSGNTGTTTVNSIGLAIYINDKKINPVSILNQN